jgi:hypothetical protein
MRRAHSFVVLLAITAVPSFGLAQVVSLQPYGPYFTIDHPIPVATVSLVRDIVALEGARVIDDGHGEPFVLGNATLNLRVPSSPTIVLTMTNATGAPIPLKDVLIYERTMVSEKDLPDLPGTTVGAPYMPMSAAGWGPGGYPDGEALQPGAGLTVELPLPPTGCDKGRSRCLAQGVVVFVGRKLPHGDRSVDPAGRAWTRDNPTAHVDSSMPAGRAWMGDNSLFTRGFLALLSEARR